MRRVLTTEDRVLGIALTRAIRPELDVLDTAHRLVEVARGKIPIQRALGRLRQGAGPRSNPLETRAEAALRRALELVDD